MRATTLIWVALLAAVAAAAAAAAETGSTIAAKLPEPVGAEIRSVRDRTALPGDIDITYHLDEEKLNRLNAFRNAKLIEKFPDLFGAEKEFPPLMTVKAYGPGQINIMGDPAAGRIMIPVGPGGERIEIYPHYSLEALEDEREIEEQITVQWKDEKGERTVDTRNLPWSSRRDFFLSPDRFGDLAYLAWATGNTWISQEDVPKQMKNLSKSKVAYESPQPVGGWQRIRTIGEILRDKKANCLDLTVWVAGNSAHSGWASKIFILGNHSMPGFGAPENLLILESTALIKSDKAGAARTVEQALDEGQHNYKEGLSQGAKEIDVLDWRTLYRYPPK